MPYKNKDLSTITSYSNYSADLALWNFLINSQCLQANPMGDPALRRHVVLSPVNTSKAYPYVLVLPGYFGSGEKYLNWQPFEKGYARQIADAVSEKRAPLAHYVFVDAWSFWGGTQYVDSIAVGRHQSHLVKELLPELKRRFKVADGVGVVMGASSGGYGALELASKYPVLFPYCVAQAPDSFFELSLMPDLIKALPFIEKHSLSALKDLHEQEKILSSKNGFAVLNAIAMSALYAPRSKKGDFDFALRKDAGTLDLRIWKRYLEFDPIVFLKKRTSNLKKLKGCYLQVGTRDEFSLHYGARKIDRILKAARVKSYHYEEFDGTHGDCSAHREELLLWLKKSLG